MNLYQNTNIKIIVAAVKKAIEGGPAFTVKVSPAFGYDGVHIELTSKEIVEGGYTGQLLNITLHYHEADGLDEVRFVANTSNLPTESMIVAAGKALLAAPEYRRMAAEVMLEHEPLYRAGIASDRAAHVQANQWAAAALTALTDRVNLTDAQRKAVGHVLGNMARYVLNLGADWQQTTLALNMADYPYSDAEGRPTLEALGRAGLCDIDPDATGRKWRYIPSSAVVAALLSIDPDTCR